MEDRKSLVDSPNAQDIHGSKSVAQTTAAFLLHWGIETHGISPTLREHRTDQRLYEMFFVWFSAGLNVFAFSTGSAGPAFFNLGLRDSILILLVVDIIGCIIPAIFAVFGPKLGTRAMVQARFSWGYHGSKVPSILNVISTLGYLILNCIIGGQTLAGVSDHLNDTTGIVVISVLTLVVTFFGYRMVHWFERLAWIPNVIVFVVMLGVGGKHLHSSSFPPYPIPMPSTILSFASFVAAGNVSWCTMTPDYGVHHNPRASSFRIFVYSYLGFLTGNIPAHLIGAAFAAAAPIVSSWQLGFGSGNNPGGLISAILVPSGGFGKFLIVLMALSTPSASAPTMYTFGTSFMSISPIFARVPRYIFAIISEAILIPTAIIGATRFYTTLIDVVDFIGYWSTAFAAIILCEHFVFRQHQFSMYNIEDWDKPRRLPPGVAAALAFAGAFGIILPSMSQAWYTGPIAAMGTGDIGLMTGFVVSGVLYFLLRTIERRWVAAESATEVF